MASEKVPMLAEGHAKLNEEVKRLKTVERPAVIDAMRVGLGSGGKLGQLEGLAGQFGGAFSAAELLDTLSNLIED